MRAVTERRIEAARHANPLTFLPGNIPITEHIRRLLDAGVSFAAAYFDLNNFKPYNDLYGYWRGDEMIKLAAQLIVAHADLSQDFVGHVGGDDFVVLFQSEDWQQRCERIVHSFNRRARELFDDSELARNGFESEDRRGFKVFFPLTTIAAGVVPVSDGRFLGPEEVASAAAAAKKAAKQSGSGVKVAGGERAPVLMMATG
ncbi:diguanylate cyclase domain-containing protein [Thauera humireducens]|uniref:diguanylate cyclase domain-containing protein n=1 Tax=Thauera humireducens TaxID=1134435 RepID=UPI0024A8E96C|nr:diguanylate cyclase [Thauera humireducens]